MPFQDAFCLVGRKLPCEYICCVIQSAANRLSGFLCCEIEKSEPSNSSGALLVCSEKMIYSCWKDIFITFVHTKTQARTHMHAPLLPRNYTNLMPHSPLLIPNSVHIFILPLNEGAATCFTPNKRKVRFILHLGQCGWVGGGGGGLGAEEGGFMHGHNPAPKGRPPLPAASHN